ncbi:Annexin Iv [Anaeromyces robustus]|jgi:hypothetical protein|uniref:Annexin Iv n=1 Tax=Anaeromyces robustus TaxID=1754192 RepID=A0A1Y1XB78_9FUNG|nr:Annexin Iv [Anaeromyces robustus]|eukprot:ORX83031.1 Annexin Iv [Anaeromyces robustus]
MHPNQQQGFPPQGFPPPQGGFPPPGGMPPQQVGFQNFQPNFGQFVQPQTPLLSQMDVDEAVKRLRDSMKGLGTNENKLISVIGTYPPLQMSQIIVAYRNKYGRSLFDDVKSETSGKFGKLAGALSLTIAEYDVRCLRKAVEGLGTDDECLLEILIGRTNSDIRFLREEYYRQYAANLVDDIKDDTSGNIRRLYSTLLKGIRDESNAPRDPNADAEEFYKAGEGRIGTNDNKFITLLCTLPDNHLRQVFDCYEKKYGHPFEKAISKEFSGQIKTALKILVSSIRNRSEYIATLFEKSMKGLGTDDAMLIRLAVRHRAPYVIEPIKQAYQEKYGKSLAKRIKGDTSGDYCKLLLACIHES